MEVVAKRLLSASRLKISELQNHTEDLKRQLKLVVDENKLYKRMQHKQVSSSTLSVYVDADVYCSRCGIAL